MYGHVRLFDVAIFWGVISASHFAIQDCCPVGLSTNELGTRPQQTRTTAAANVPLSLC